MADREMDEYDVAVVVYCRARGVDESDAQSRAERALLEDILRGRKPLPWPVTDEVKVAGFTGLSHAHVAMRPDATMFKRAGMGEPRKAPMPDYYGGSGHLTEDEKRLGLDGK